MVEVCTTASETLTSLAMLKVSVDQGGDYLDYLRPFILHVLVEQKPDPVTALSLEGDLRTQFGLEIPQRAIQVVLKRLSRQYPLKQEMGVYRITGTLPDPGIAAKKSEAARHIQSVSSGLMEFSKSTAKPIATSDEAVTAICAFFTQFSIPCLRAYLRGTAIPTLLGKHDTDIVLVSQYVLHLQHTDPERFDSIVIMVQGHMLANALLCPDLHSAPKTYKGVKFYLDTPLLIRLLGLEGELKRAAIDNLISLLHNLGATVVIFSHSRQELERVLNGVANFVDNPKGRGTIIMEARRSGTTKSDILLLAGQIDDRLAEAKIEVESTPQYISDFQIDEMAFEQVLDDDVAYFNPRAKEYDINSVRSIYVLRAHTAPSTLEKCKAVLVSSNSGFARAAFDYGQQYEESREVSSVITDFGLANMAWLKAPMGAPSLPTSEILAFSYAALQPSKAFLDKVMVEIDKLEEKGRITARDHQLFRSSTLAQEELMRLTLGDEEALTEEAYSETLRRVTAEITKEEGAKLKAEQEAHRITQEELAAHLDKRNRFQERLYWRCHGRARKCAWLLSGLVGLLLLAGFAAGLGVRPSNPILGSLLTASFAFFILLSLWNIIFGTTAKDLHQRVHDRCLGWFIKREAAATGLDMGGFQ